jgi:DNA-binding response OmpR family regulator
MATILLVENDEEFRQHLADGIRSAGHRVVEAANGSDGLARFDTDAPALVITDIVMEQVEGIELLLDIRKQAPELPVIAISGNDQYLRNSRKLGATRALLKPFRVRELLDCIDDLISV